MDGKVDATDFVEDINLFLPNYSSLQTDDQFLAREPKSQHSERCDSLQEEIDVLTVAVKAIKMDLASFVSERDELKADVFGLQLFVEEKKRSQKQAQEITQDSKISEPSIENKASLTNSSSSTQEMNFTSPFTQTKRMNHSIDVEEGAGGSIDLERRSLSDANTSTIDEQAQHLRKDITGGKVDAEYKTTSFPTIAVQVLEDDTITSASSGVPRMLSKKRNSYFGTASFANLLSPMSYTPPPCQAEQSIHTGARSFSLSLSSVTSTKQQQEEQDQKIHVAHLQALLAEQEMKVQERDAQLEKMQREMQILKLEMDEAKDARIASESCLRTLKDFIREKASCSTNLEESQDDEMSSILQRDVSLDPSSSSFLLQTPSECHAPTQNGTSSISWRRLSTTFTGLSRPRSHTVEELNDKLELLEKEDSQLSNNNDSASGVSPPISPTTSDFSIGSLWTAVSTKKRQSVSPGEPFDTTLPSLSETSSLTSSPSSSTFALPLTPTTGQTWFSRRGSRRDSIAVDPIDSPIRNSRRVSSPPFASLDHHVVIVEEVNGPDLKQSLEPRNRVRRAMEKTNSVDEDTGFVAPYFVIEE